MSEGLREIEVHDDEATAEDREWAWETWSTLTKAVNDGFCSEGTAVLMLAKERVAWRKLALLDDPEADRALSASPAGDWAELIRLIMAGYVKEAGTKAEAMASRAVEPTR